MVTTPASGPITKAEEHLANMIANCATFQSITSSDDAAEAIDHVYFDSLPVPAGNLPQHSAAELQSYRPFALVYSDESSVIRYTLRGIDASGFRFGQRGTVKFFLEIDIDPDDSDEPQEAERKVKNSFGKIIDELAELAGQPGYIAASSIDFTGPVRAHPDDVQDVGDFHCGWFEMSYDDQGA